MLCSDLRSHLPRYDRGKARAHFLTVAKQKKPRRRKIKAAIRRQLDYLQRNLDAIDALIASGAVLSGLKTHWWQKLLVISELNRQQNILLNAKTRSIPDRIINLVQRQVRPIVRGKARAAVEFGAKISVSVRNGYAFLHRISCSAQTSANETRWRESLDLERGSMRSSLIMARLAKGPETSISMAFLVMCAEKILRLISLLFVFIYGCLCSLLWLHSSPGRTWTITDDSWNDWPVTA